MGLGAVPLMCAREIPVAGSKPRVVRILAHFYTARTQADVSHAYLDGADFCSVDTRDAGAAEFTGERVHRAFDSRSVVPPSGRKRSCNPARSRPRN